ncbi:DKNYY domain-containing protein [Verrucomicrobium spinosum]|uniref:DKNYY domain-containing protein n=1 Tax=Verrucomicrobium spinosum TaxID=2736 RepID=UPI0009D74669|nr:DKNYY domain-containing protein [Verrucomicrobium spinosum]
MHSARRCWFRGLTLAALLSATQCNKEKPPGALDRSGYHVRGSKVYFLPNWTSRAWEIPEVELATFEFPLPKGTETDYARDRQSVYWRGNKISGVDPKTFEILDSGYAHDASNVYRNGTLICDDAAHFEMVSGNFVKNSHTVYALYPATTPVSHDPANFREISAQDGYSFCADLAQVFVNGNTIPGAHPATFRVLQGGYTQDAGQSFYFDKPMPEGTEIESLEILAGAYAKDAARVYHLGQVVAGADPATFIVTDDKFQRARDAHQEYEQGQRKPRPAPPEPPPQRGQ